MRHVVASRRESYASSLLHRLATPLPVGVERLVKPYPLLRMPRIVTQQRSRLLDNQKVFYDMLVYLHG
jgi:hypothetical protein